MDSMNIAYFFASELSKIFSHLPGVPPFKLFWFRSIGSKLGFCFSRNACISYINGDIFCWLDNSRMTVIFLQHLEDTLPLSPGFGFCGWENCCQSVIPLKVVHFLFFNAFKIFGLLLLLGMLFSTCPGLDLFCLVGKLPWLLCPCIHVPQF